MKKKKWTNSVKLLMVFSLFIILSCQREDLTPPNLDNYDVSAEQVKSIAQNFSQTSVFENSPNKLLKTGSNDSKKNREIEKIYSISKNNNVAFYIITYQPTGFVIVSATKKEEPILAYSEINTFDTNEISYGLQMWMECFKERIFKLKISNITVPIAITNEWDKLSDEEWDPENPDLPSYNITVGPLINTTWGQGPGFNSLLTPINSQLPPTGCVATAMAQVMKYHQYPNSYNWSEMPNNYGTSETARLMRDIGSAVGMTYDLEGSGADVEKEVAQSFINDFGYSGSAQFIGDYLSNYEKIPLEIDAGRPVILRGGTKKYWAGLIPYYADGHAWVCEGYSQTAGDGIVQLRLYMNWGLNGSNNGFYSFSNFNPGIYSFNYKAGMVIGIKP